MSHPGYSSRGAPFQVRAFTYPKDARAPDQIQDAFAIGERQGVAAIADGVGTTLFSAAWAKLITEAAAADPPNPRNGQLLAAWLSKQRQAWIAPIDVNSLAWHQKPKFQEGAAATLLWTKILPVEEPGGAPPQTFRMYCYAIGDSCLFHVSGGQVQRAFPFEDSRLFAAPPRVLRSVEKAGQVPAEFDTLEDGCERGDLLALATDALALWALEELEHGRNPDFDSFWNLSAAQWNARIEELRAARRIRVDDTTLVLLRIG